MLIIVSPIKAVLKYLKVRFKVNNDILGNSSPSDSNNSTDSGRIFSTVTPEMEVTEIILANI
jgi:hypothetical protein